MSKRDNTLFCFRCYHTWKKRKENPPKFCPKCKSPYWNRPRKRASKDLVLKIKETIINVHDAIIKLSGGERGMRDEGGLYNSTYKILNHQDKHKDEPTSLGAFILNEIAKRHYFVDGNKRTAYVISKMFMLINKCHLKTDYNNSIKFILDVAKHESKISFNQIKSWLSKNCSYIEEKDVETYLNKALVSLVVEVNENG